MSASASRSRRSKMTSPSAPACRPRGCTATLAPDLLHRQSTQAAPSWARSYPHGTKALHEGPRDGSSPRDSSPAGTEKHELPETRLKRIGCVAAGHTLITAQPARLTFRAAVRDVLDDYRINRKRSLVDVQRHLRLHLEPFFGRRRMAAIATADVRRYIGRRQGEGAKNATINRELSVLKRAFTLAIAAGTLPSRPHIPLLREDNVRRGFFEAGEFESVRHRLPPDLADFVSFLYTTGWRWRSEAARLRWTNVAFGGGEVRLDPGTTKTGEGRVFPLTAELRALLERRRAVTRQRECEPGRLVPHVFTRANGEPP